MKKRSKAVKKMIHYQLLNFNMNFKKFRILIMISNSSFTIKNRVFDEILDEKVQIYSFEKEICDYPDNWWCLQ